MTLLDTINVYVTPGPKAFRLMRLSKEAVESGAGIVIEHYFLKKVSGKGKGRSKKTKSGEESPGPLPTYVRGPWPPPRTKSGPSRVTDDEEEVNDSDVDDQPFARDVSMNMEGTTMINDSEIIELSDDDEEPPVKRKLQNASSAKKRAKLDRGRILARSSDGEEDSDDDYPSGDADGFTFVRGRDTAPKTPSRTRSKPIEIIDVSP
jgi:hypothetical protein